MANSPQARARARISRTVIYIGNVFEHAIADDGSQRLVRERHLRRAGQDEIAVDRGRRAAHSFRSVPRGPVDIDRLGKGDRGEMAIAQPTSSTDEAGHAAMKRDSTERSNARWGAIVGVVFQKSGDEARDAWFLSLFSVVPGSRAGKHNGRPEGRADTGSFELSWGIPPARKPAESMRTVSRLCNT